MQELKHKLKTEHKNKLYALFDYLKAKNRFLSPEYINFDGYFIYFKLELKGYIIEISLNDLDKCLIWADLNILAVQILRDY